MAYDVHVHDGDDRFGLSDGEGNDAPSVRFPRDGIDSDPVGALAPFMNDVPSGSGVPETISTQDVVAFAVSVLPTNEHQDGGSTFRPGFDRRGNPVMVSSHVIEDLPPEPIEPRRREAPRADINPRPLRAPRREIVSPTPDNASQHATFYSMCDRYINDVVANKTEELTTELGFIKSERDMLLERNTQIVNETNRVMEQLRTGLQERATECVALRTQVAQQERLIAENKEFMCTAIEELLCVVKRVSDHGLRFASNLIRNQYPPSVWSMLLGSPPAMADALSALIPHDKTTPIVPCNTPIVKKVDNAAIAAGINGEDSRPQTFMWVTQYLNSLMFVTPPDVLGYLLANNESHGAVSAGGDGAFIAFQPAGNITPTDVSLHSQAGPAATRSAKN